MIRIPVERYDERIVLEIPETDREFGGIPLDMIGRINLGPFAEGVPATMPDKTEEPPPRPRATRYKKEPEPTLFSEAV